MVETYGHSRTARCAALPANGQADPLRKPDLLAGFPAKNPAKRPNTLGTLLELGFELVDLVHPLLELCICRVLADATYGPAQDFSAAEPR